jgi:glycine oxidase
MITIIGGGVFGLSIGWRLAQAGRSVTIFEKGKVGHGATWAAAGMLMPWKLSRAFNQALFDLQRAGHALWPEFAADLIDASGIDIEYQTEGRLFVALDEKAVNRFRWQYDYHRRLGFPLDWLTGDEARRYEPGLGPQVEAAIFSSMGHWVDNRQLVAALRQAFVQAGGLLRENTPVIGLEIEQQQVKALRLPTETISTETVILAAGAWSSDLAGLPVQYVDLIQPLKGQTLTLQMSPGQSTLNQPIIGPVYLVPRRDGRLIIGTTVEEEAGFDTRPTVSGVLDILTKAIAIAPSIAMLPIIEMSAGLRPTGPQRLPVLGPTTVDGLILASGGHGYGILLSPIVAQAICQQVLNYETITLIEPFLSQQT